MLIVKSKAASRKDGIGKPQYVGIEMCQMGHTVISTAGTRMMCHVACSMAYLGIDTVQESFNHILIKFVSSFHHCKDSCG